MSKCFFFFCAQDAQWNNLVSMLPSDDTRYVVADVHYNVKEGPRTDMVFITWAPDTASIKKKMILASSADALKSTLVGLKTSVQACC